LAPDLLRRSPAPAETAFRVNSGLDLRAIETGVAGSPEYVKRA
jgi:hypothetical protein